MTKTVLIGVTGCIAAYKSCEIVRQLQKRGHRVKVVMTEHATQFVDPTTFRALTREPVALGLFDAPSDPIHHISLAQECDVFMIAPCTANVAGKIANGIADDLLTTTAMAVTAPLMIAPAMNVNMYNSSAFQDNLAKLKSRGVTVVDADEGYLACGDTGKGRLADPEAICDAIDAMLQSQQDLAGKRVLVTAGPTYEPIDGVRFVGNRSSGKMGYAVASAAAERGAQVTLVSGPVALNDPAGVSTVRVETACEMLAAAQMAFETADIAVFSAAVADYRPAQPVEGKLKKGVDDDALASIAMTKNPDILATLAAGKAAGQVVVGFAAETDDVVANGQAKLVRKNADIIVANDVSCGKVFGADENKAFFITAVGVDEQPLMSKRALADAILTKAACLL